MRALVDWLRSFLTTTFGRCEKCMRIALRSVVFAWAGVAVVFWISPSRTFLLLTLMVAAGLTINALLHIVMYAARQVAATGRGARSVPPVIGGRGPAPAL